MFGKFISKHVFFSTYVPKQACWFIWVICLYASFTHLREAQAFPHCNRRKYNLQIWPQIRQTEIGLKVASETQNPPNM